MPKSHFSEEEIKRIRYMFTDNAEIDENNITIIPWCDNDIENIELLTDEEVVEKYIKYYIEFEKDLEETEDTQLHNIFITEKIIDGEDLKGIINVQEC